jgi:hypothetical protein
LHFFVSVVMQARWKLSVTVNQLTGKVQDQQATTAHVQTQAQLQHEEVSWYQTRVVLLKPVPGNVLFTHVLFTFAGGKIIHRGAAPARATKKRK